MREKGQIVTTEALAAFVIFSLVMVTVFFIWDVTYRRILKAEVLSDMETRSADALEKLVRTSGMPGGWENLSVENVSTIGLANESRILSEAKVLRFLDMMEDEASADAFNNPCYNATEPETFNVSKYECNKYLLGLEKYEFYVTITDRDGEVVSVGGVNCSTGRQPTDPDYLIYLGRSALLDDDIVKLSFEVWS